MLNFNITSAEYDPLPSVRAATQLASTYMKERPKRKLETSGKRPGSLSPLQLTYKTLDDVDFKGLCIGLMKLQSRGKPPSQEAPDISPATAMGHGFLSKHYNFSENKRLTNKLDFTKIKKNQRIGDSYPEKYEVISKDQRFAGRSPEKFNLVKGVIPVTTARFHKRLSENSVRLRICGVMKCFSPRESGHSLDPVLFTFKK